MSSKTSFLFEDDVNCEQFEILWKKSSPRRANRLVFDETIADFDYGEITFRLKNNNSDARIHFFDKSSLNKFWKFFEALVKTDLPLIFRIFHCGCETILYIEPYDKNELRFIIADSFELHRKQKENIIRDYSYEDFDIKLDIHIRKRQFVKQFYLNMTGVFTKYQDIVFFEPPAFDFNLWIKDSLIVKTYVKGKRFQNHSEEKKECFG